METITKDELLNLILRKMGDYQIEFGEFEEYRHYREAADASAKHKAMCEFELEVHRFFERKKEK